MTAEEWSAARLSLQVAACAVFFTLPAGIAVGYLLVRWRWPGRWLAETIINLPLVLPPVVTGYLLLLFLTPAGPVGGWLDHYLGIRIVFTWWAAALASGIVSFPLMVRAIRLGFQSVDRRLELAARALGASRLDTFCSVTLPLARHGIFAGCGLAFARSLGEFGATIMVAGDIAGETRTIPLAIFSLSNRPGGLGQGWRLVALSILLCVLALAASEWFERRRRSP